LAQAAEESLRQALFRSGRPAAEVGTAVIAGTGDPQVDAAVRRALGAVLGEQLHICDVTLASGRTGGADGTLAVAIAVEALCRGVVPTQGLPRTGTLVVCLAADRTGSTTALVLTGATAGPDASTVRGATTVRDTTTGPGERT
jgi:3-oxoacyl-[acyl-carrier-protein] synthase II